MKRFKRLLIVMLPSLFLFLAFEAGLRIYHAVAGDDDSEQQAAVEWWQYDPRLCWVARPDYSGEVFGVWRVFDREGFLAVDSDQINKGTKPRILLIGDSCAFGHGVAVDSTFGELLEKMLPAYDVVNLALPGYTSLQGLIVLEQRIAGIKPDIVIASFGFNDRRYVLNERAVDSRAYFAQVNRNARMAPILAEYSYVVRAIYRIIRGGDSASPVSPVPGDEEYYVHTVFPRVSPEDYRNNLKQIVDLAVQNNARVILLSLADSPRRAGGLYEGIKLLEEGKHSAALEKLVPVAYGKSVFSSLAKRVLFESLEERGHHSDARKVGRIEELIVSLHGGKPIFLDIEYAAIMEEAAADRGAAFVDGTTALKEHPEFFMDFSHFNESGHRLIATMLAETIEKRVGG